MPGPDPQASKAGKVFGIPAKVFAILAIMAGTMSCFQRAIRGSGASLEDIMIYAAPAVVGAVIALAAERSPLTYVGVGFGLLGIIALMLGG